MFILQGVAQAGAVHVANDANDMTEQHCAGHAPDRGDCDCCPDGALVTHGGCAALCSVVATLPAASTYVPRITTSPPVELAAIVRVNPAYLPLTPPPIS